ncbi:unnamed protein product, partial [Brachionus calyciflorus]
MALEYLKNRFYILFKNEKNKKINNKIPNEFQSNDVQYNNEKVIDNENENVNSNAINPCGSNANFNEYSSSLYTSTEDYLDTSESSCSEMSLSSDYRVESKNISNSIRNKNQFSSEEANQTRLVTKCRYFAEVVN